MNLATCSRMINFYSNILTQDINNRTYRQLKYSSMSRCSLKDMKVCAQFAVVYFHLELRQVDILD